MKVYIVSESYRDWDEGWDNNLGVYSSKEEAERICEMKIKQALEDGDFKIDYYVEEHEVI